MTYADYAYYTGTFLGKAIAEADFPGLALRASLFLDYATMGRAKKKADLDAVKMACCAVAEVYNTIETAQALANKSLAESVTAISEGSGELQSESVGSWSQSYRSGGSSSAEALKASAAAQEQLMETARMYLAGTGLLRARGYMA